MIFYEKLLAKVFSCPQCKGEMQEVHRAQENGYVYIWLECKKPECAGQWLQKIPISTQVEESADADSLDRELLSS